MSTARKRTTFRTVEGFKQWAFEHGSEMYTEYESEGDPIVTKCADFPRGILSITFDTAEGRIIDGWAHCDHMSHGLGSNTLAALLRLVTR